MNLAILTQYYPPETGAPQNRLSDLAHRLTMAGHSVEVLTALPNYPGDAVLPEYRGRENMVEVVDGVRIARVGLYVPRAKSFARRLACYFSFAANAARQGPRLLSRADVILMESPPLFLAPAGVWLARVWGARLVVNVSDLWPQSVVDLGMIGPGPSLWAAGALERWMYRSAAAVTGQTQGIVEEIQRRVPGKRVELYPNGVDVMAYDRPLDRAGVRASFAWHDELFVAGYAGVLGHAQSLGQVLDAARLLSNVPNVHFAFFGDGPCRVELEARIEREQIVSARVYPRQPAARMPDLQSAFDAGLVPLARGKVFEGARPSKMFEILAAARPVILCGRGEARRIVEGPAHGPAGVSVDPEDPPALAAAIRRLIDDRPAATAMGERGRSYVFSTFDRELIARGVEDLLLATIEEGRS